LTRGGWPGHQFCTLAVAAVRICRHACLQITMPHRLRARLGSFGPFHRGGSICQGQISTQPARRCILALCYGVNSALCSALRHSTGLAAEWIRLALNVIGTSPVVCQHTSLVCIMWAGMPSDT
jgi:hypothetical protein